MEIKFCNQGNVPSVFDKETDHSDPILSLTSCFSKRNTVFYTNIRMSFQNKTYVCCMDILSKHPFHQSIVF